MKEGNERFKVVYLYIKNFEYKDKSIGSKFNYEPQSGKVYRSVYDTKGGTWMLKTEGIQVPGYHGINITELKADNPSWACDIIEINYNTVMDITLPETEVLKMLEWDSEPSINEQFMKEMLSPPKSLGDYDDWDEVFSEKVPSESVVVNNSDKDEVLEVFNQLLQDYADVYNERDGVGEVLLDVIEYLKTTYSDKYTDTSSPLEMKNFYYSKKHGKSVNTFSATKYIQRYLTEGYSKSGNVIDLMKAIHYLLFELARVKIQTYADATHKGRPDEGHRRDEKNDLGLEDGSKDTPKATRKRGGRPKKSDKE